MLQTLIIITGLPGTGKTTLGNRLSQDLRLPFITKDAIKETLFDTVGWKDRAWSQTLGYASFELLDYFAQSLLRAGHSLVLEANFDPQFYNGKLRAWQEEHIFTPLQILCTTDSTVLLERFKARSLSGERHSGHCDQFTYQELQYKVADQETGRLDCGGKVIEINTSKPGDLDYLKLRNEVESILEQGVRRGSS